jgi:hypothetical protein
MNQSSLQNEFPTRNKQSLWFSPGHHYNSKEPFFFVLPTLKLYGGWPCTLGATVFVEVTHIL